MPHRSLWSSSTTPRSFCHVWKAHTKWSELAETLCSKSLSQRLWRETTSSFAQPRFLKITWRGPPKERTREWIWAVWFFAVPFLGFFYCFKERPSKTSGWNLSRFKSHTLTGTGTESHTEDSSPGNTWQDLSKSPGSAVHSCWRSPVQGGIAATVEHMLFVETPESVSSFLPPPSPSPSPAFQATRLLKPLACGWSNSHESFNHRHYTRLPLCMLFSSRDTFKSLWFNLYS